MRGSWVRSVPAPASTLKQFLWCLRFTKWFPPIHYVMEPLHYYHRKHQNQNLYHSFREHFFHLNPRRQILDAPLCILPAQELLINKLFFWAMDSLQSLRGFLYFLFFIGNLRPLFSEFRHPSCVCS